VQELLLIARDRDRYSNSISELKTCQNGNTPPVFYI